MADNTGYRFETRVIHDGIHNPDWEGATLPPIFQTASHLHPTAESLSRTFAGKTGDHIYMRLSNPTNQALEQKLASLESGAGAVVMSSGMAAITNACMALLRAGDEFVSSRSLFMSTFLLFTRIFKKYGITANLVDANDPGSVVRAVTERTRFVYLETIGNPGMDIPDVAAVAGAAHDHGLPLVVDNTLASPWLFQPLVCGADVVVHSTTKYFGGHGAATGGVVIDGGTFDWTGSRFPDFAPFVERKGDLAFLDRVWREHHINFGTTQAPFHSFLTFLGLDTLALRMERHMANAMKVARFLREHSAVRWVNYPGFEDHPGFGTATRQFQGKGYGGMLTFGLGDQEACFRFINRLKLVCHLANLGDCKTLVIHPWSTQYVAFEEPARKEHGITADMIRLSVGIEAWQDICQDLDQALGAI
ncbi:MAG: aminotransferase class I/II-fold pyridoxal phosphate-dependent enzyme [Pseudomonadota bacterium]